MANYIGRFAPSPTGPLHFGSLFAAVISYLDAKQNKGKWLVRIEDIDPLREQANAPSLILKTLEAHGLFWDDHVTYQSQRSQLYEQRISELASKQYVFFCPCSRKQLAKNNGVHLEHCIKGTFDINSAALKFGANRKDYCWTDQLQSLMKYPLDNDFVIKRKEGFYSYQLAVVCDDIEQGITKVVRGYDLLDSTPMQLALYQALSVKPPQYSHFPVISHKGQKLSKQNLSPAVCNLKAKQNLLTVFKLLGINKFDSGASIEDLLTQATLSWQHSLLKNKQSIPIP